MRDDELAAIHAIDAWLDSGCSPGYQRQPLAQDWARVAKITEEAGEAVSELILATGQNPRKPLDPAAAERLLDELADAALTAILAIQHFVKDADATDAILRERLERTRKRAGIAAALQDQVP